MAVRSFTVPVDFEKLERVRISNGFDLTEMSRELGHERSWYSHAKAKGAMRKTDVLLAKQKWGIDVLIKEVPKEPVETTEKAEEIVIDYEKLGEVMSKAIDYDRLAQIMSNIIDYERLGEVLTESVRRALND